MEGFGVVEWREEIGVLVRLCWCYMRMNCRKEIVVRRVFERIVFIFIIILFRIENDMGIL